MTRRRRLLERLLERLLNGLAWWLERRGSYTRIGRPGGRRYLDRYYIWRREGRGGLMLHRFWDSDSDVPHDHPWRNRSMLLVGSYEEHVYVPQPGHPPMEVGVFLSAPFTLTPWRRAERIHRVVVPLFERPVWTLFWYGRRERRWGFWHDDGTFEPFVEGPPERPESLCGRLFPRRVS